MYFTSPTKLFWNVNSTDQLKELLKSNSLAIVIGKGSIKRNEKFKEILSNLKKEKDVLLIEGIKENPEISDVLYVMDKIKSSGIKEVIAIGGGSVLDCTKAAITIVNEKDPEKSLIEKKVNNRSDITLISIPTTCGTGSEVDQYALITDRNGDKFSFFTEYSFPEYAILEPELLKTLPEKWVNSTSIDAFCHSLEGFFSNKSNEFTDTLAIKSMELILENVILEKNRETLSNLLLASSLAGIVIAHTGTNLIHGFGYYLTKKKGISHSISNSSLLPFYIEYLSKIKDPKVDFFMGFLTPEDKPYSFMVDFLKSLNLPSHLKETGIDEKDFDIFFEYGFNKPNIKSFFKEVKRKEIFRELKNWFQNP